jgi:hypothetical protein
MHGWPILGRTVRKMKTKLIIAMTIAALATLAMGCGGDDDGGGADVTDTPAASNGDGTQTQQTATCGGDSGPDKPPAADGEPVTTASGLQYIMIKEGRATAQPNSTRSSVHYTGWLAPDGPKFDSSADRGQPTSFPVNGVIGGLRRDSRTSSRVERSG